MSKTIKRGATSKKIFVRIADATQNDNSGKTGLLFNTSGLSCYYVRDGDATATAVTLATATVGTWTSSGFKEVDATHMPGVYEFGIPNAALSSGEATVIVFEDTSGLLNMVKTPVEVPLVAYDPQDSASLGLTAVVPNLSVTDQIETGYTAKQAMRLMLSALAGKVSGGGTTSNIFRDVNDGANRIIATVDTSGNRTAVTLTP